MVKRLAARSIDALHFQNIQNLKGASLGVVEIHDKRSLDNLDLINTGKRFTAPGSHRLPVVDWKAIGLRTDAKTLS